MQNLKINVQNEQRDMKSSQQTHISKKLSINDVLKLNKAKTSPIQKVIVRFQIFFKILFHYLDFVSDINTVYETYMVYETSTVPEQKFVYFQQVGLCLTCIGFDRLITYIFLKTILKEKKQKNVNRKSFFLSALFLDYIYLSMEKDTKSLSQRMVQKEIIELFCENFILCMQNQILIQRSFLEGKKIDFLIVVGFLTSIMSICMVLYKAYTHRYRQQAVLKFKFEQKFDDLDYETKLFILDIYRPQIMKQNSTLMDDHVELFREKQNPYFIDKHLPLKKRFLILLIILYSVLIQVFLVVQSELTVWPYYAQNASIVCLTSYSPQMYRFFKLKFQKLTSKKDRFLEILKAFAVLPLLAVISMLQVICPIKIETIVGVPEIKESHVLNVMPSWYNEIARLIVWFQMLFVGYKFLDGDRGFMGHTEITTEEEYQRAIAHDSVIRYTYNICIVIYVIYIVQMVAKLLQHQYRKLHNKREEDLQIYKEYMENKEQELSDIEKRSEQKNEYPVSPSRQYFQSRNFIYNQQYMEGQQFDNKYSQSQRLISNKNFLSVNQQYAQSKSPSIFKQKKHIIRSENKIENQQLNNQQQQDYRIIVKDNSSFNNNNKKIDKNESLKLTNYIKEKIIQQNELKEKQNGVIELTQGSPSSSDDISIAQEKKRKQNTFKNLNIDEESFSFNFKAQQQYQIDEMNQGESVISPQQSANCTQNIFLKNKKPKFQEMVSDIQLQYQNSNKDDLQNQIMDYDSSCSDIPTEEKEEEEEENQQQQKQNKKQQIYLSQDLKF